MNSLTEASNWAGACGSLARIAYEARSALSYSIASSIRLPSISPARARMDMSPVPMSDSSWASQNKELIATQVTATIPISGMPASAMSLRLRVARLK